MIIRNNRKSLAVIAALSGFAGCAAGPVLGAPTSLASQNDLGKMWKTGGVTSVASVPVAGQPFKTAVSFTAPKKMAHYWDAQAGAGPKASVSAGDVLLATFYIRSTSPASGGQVTFSFGDAGPKYERSGWIDLKPRNTWKKVSLPFASKGTYGPGKWLISFQLGTMAQTVQIADFHLVDYGKSKSIQSLPKSGT